MKARVIRVSPGRAGWRERQVFENGHPFIGTTGDPLTGKAWRAKCPAPPQPEETPAARGL